MKNSVFLVFSLMLTLVFSLTYTFMRYRFSGVEELQLRVSHLQKKLEHEELKSQLVGQQLNEYREQIATLVPEAQEKATDQKDSYQLRVLASVVSAPNSDFLKLERATGLFERGKDAFRKGDHEKSAGIFKDLIEKYPESVHVPESFFLMAESQYQLREFDVCVDTVESMITLFPDSDLTGFALLRLAKIFETQDRLEDAVEIYRTVLASYHDNQLIQQANSNLKAVEL